MKRVVMFMILVMSFLTFAAAQSLPDPPGDWSDIIISPSKWFVDFGAVTVLTAFLATVFNGLLKVQKKFPRQLVAWAVGIILIVATSLLNFGYAAGFPILLAVGHGFMAGLVSNGIFDIPLAKGLLNIIEQWLNPKRE